MFSANAGSMASPLTVSIVNGRTKSPEEWATEITDKILSVADTAPMPIREQAVHFKSQIWKVVRDNIAFALEQEHEWMAKQSRG